MNNENSPTLNGWPAGPNAFGLYLILGSLLALIVVGVFSLSGAGRRISSVEPPKKEIRIQHSKAAGHGAGVTSVPDSSADTNR